MDHFHTLKVSMPRDDYIDEHRRLVKALESKDPGLLKEELKEQKADLDKAVKGGGIKEDKRYINSKTAWSLAHLEKKVLMEFYNNPAVPPSMKAKLKEAMMVKPSLKLKGGLKGVSKASGFIRRLMWENSHKHKGAYGNPTWGLAADSKMNKGAKFELKKLASESQGGLNKGEYGASPFITHHFSTGTRKPKQKTKPETAAQKRAREKFKVEVTAETVIPTHPALLEHFANQPKEEPKPKKEEEPKDKAEPKEEKKPKEELPFLNDTKGTESRWRAIDAETDFYGTGPEAAAYIEQLKKERAAKKKKGGSLPDVPPMCGV